MFIKKIKRNKIKKQPFSKEWRKIMERNVPLYNCLPGKLKAELQDHIKIFISEKNIEGCGGLTITDEINQLTHEMLVSKSWAKKKFRRYDLKAPVPAAYPAHGIHLECRIGRVFNATVKME